MTLTSQIDSLLSGSDAPVQIDAGGLAVPLRFWRGGAGAKVLIISFHGAIDRATREVPAFLPHFAEFGDACHQLAVSDPSMLAAGCHAMSWYAGHQGAAVQPALLQLFKAVVAGLGVERVVYLGTSVGGFAALFYSWHHPGSLALVGNPQTRISDYYPRHVAAYRAECWPGLAPDAPLDSVICENVRTLYGTGVANHVIYVQNPTDSFHLFNHMVPFLAAIAGAEPRARIVVDVTYPGKPGHSPAWPILKRWLQAAIVAPGWTPEDLHATHHDLAQGTTAPPAQSAPRAKAAATAGPAHSAHDLRLAALLRDLALKP